MRGSIFKRFGIKLTLNDPRWGHNPKGDHKAQEGRRPGEGGGPPDLDQLWRDFNARLNRLFGSRGGDGGGPLRPDARGAGITVSIVVAIAILIWLASGAFIVQEGQVGVVSTFGKYSHTTGPGFNWRWPYPFQSAEIVNVSQVRTAEIGYRANVRNKQPQEALMLTDDENIIDIQFAVQYKLKDPVAWVFNNRDQDEAVRQIAETAVRAVVGKSKMDYVLYEGRDKVAVDVHNMMQQLADRYKLGVQIANVTMLAVQPPEQVQAAFDDAVKAGQDRVRLRNEGEAYANDVIPNARGKAFRLIQDAEAYRSMVVENATGNAARFSQVVTEYAKAPAVTRDRMYLDTMQEIFTSTSKVMIDTKTNNNMLYLPLDKLMAQAAGEGAKSGPVQPHPQPPVQSQSAVPAQDAMQTMESVRSRDLRSRDATRERERESR
ncbi:FtsH protease activity modulator HflK [Massilia horti]|uniref:Protein HflK n=1 Tax=Massilia horti TaxID=2562153 RepID=A0A4Y9SV30_9BURK|nr:FtsH protease activity modulator HflK [Massilia horti]TFW28606.1 FtsH protease activity modulator HflK [Massilia horti]